MALDSGHRSISLTVDDTKRLVGGVASVTRVTLVMVKDRAVGSIREERRGGHEGRPGSYSITVQHSTFLLGSKLPSASAVVLFSGSSILKAELRVFFEARYHFYI